jgi:hypothetical protein
MVYLLTLHEDLLLFLFQYVGAILGPTECDLEDKIYARSLRMV